MAELVVTIPAGWRIYKGPAKKGDVFFNHDTFTWDKVPMDEHWEIGQQSSEYALVIKEL